MLHFTCPRFYAKHGVDWNLDTPAVNVDEGLVAVSSNLTSTRTVGSSYYYRDRYHDHTSNFLLDAINAFSKACGFQMWVAQLQRSSGDAATGGPPDLDTIVAMSKALAAVRVVLCTRCVQSSSHSVTRLPVPLSPGEQPPDAHLSEGLPQGGSRRRV